jgi:hypothetical protein
MHGTGVLVEADGRKYEGEFLEGCFHGQGEMHWPETNTSYKGGWALGL